MQRVAVRERHPPQPPVEAAAGGEPNRGQGGDQEEGRVGVAVANRVLQGRPIQELAQIVAGQEHPQGDEPGKEAGEGQRHQREMDARAEQGAGPEAHPEGQRVDKDPLRIRDGDIGRRAPQRGERRPQCQRDERPQCDGGRATKAHSRRSEQRQQDESGAQGGRGWIERRAEPAPVLPCPHREHRRQQDQRNQAGGRGSRESRRLLPRGHGGSRRLVLRRALAARCLTHCQGSCP